MNELHEFFSASVGAAAGLIGLLFVAISVAPENIFGRGADVSRRADAERAFTALSNVFFVSLAVLIPRSAITAVAVVAALSLVQIARMIVIVLRGSPAWRTLQHAGLISLGIYSFELVIALRLRAATGSPNTLIYIALGLYAYALGISWQLLAARAPAASER